MNDEKIRMMRDEKIPKVLLKMGLPTMIGMLVGALYNVVDAYFVGGLGTSQMGAVSVVFPVGQVLIGLGLIFGSGAASYISRLLGEGRTEKASQTASTALLSSLAVGGVMIAATLCFMDRILVALGATETILPYARAYAMIYVSGAILNIFNVAMNNIVTGEGAAKLTMTAMLVGGGLNAVLDPIFIYSLGLGVRGAAIATVLSQAVTTLLYVRYIVGKSGFLQYSVRHFVFDRDIYTQVLKVGVPLLVFQFLSSLAMGMTNTAASDYGDAAVAAMGVVTRIFAIGAYAVFGYVKGLQPVAGYNYGAKQYTRLRESIRVSLKWSTWFCGVVALLFIMFPGAIVSLFSKSDPLLVDIGSRALRANGILFGAFGFQMVYSTVYLALGRARQGGILSMSRQGIFFIPAVLILPRLMGLSGVIYAQPVADLLTILLTAVFAIGLQRELRRLDTDAAAPIVRTVEESI